MRDHSASTTAPQQDNAAPQNKKRIEILRMDQLIDEPVQWLIEDLIPAKCIRGDIREARKLQVIRGNIPQPDDRSRQTGI